jgi:hypothetical protein
MNDQILDIVGSDHMGPTGARGQILLVNYPAVQPPDVAAPIDLSPASQRDILTVINRNETLVAVAVFVYWPVAHAVACTNFTADLNHDVTRVVYSEGQGVESLLMGDDDHSIIAHRGGGIGLFNCQLNDALVGELRGECVLVGNGTHKEDILCGVGLQHQQADNCSSAQHNTINFISNFLRLLIKEGSN